ncbi:MAG: DPP IV N-terminal domain-containing protein [Chloroflexota bacterium]
MPKHLPLLSKLTTLIVLTTLLLLSCSRQLATETAVAEEPTPTTEVISVVSKNTQEMILFSYEEDGYAHLFAYIPEQMPLTRLTSGDWDDITPASSPDGEKLAFASNRSGYWDLYLLDLSSGDVTQLTNTPEYEGAPTWSPDGSFMAFEVYENENLNVLVGPANDPLNNPIRLTTSAASDHSPAWAPDGRHIAFISDGEVILADLDKTGDDRFENISNTELASESHPVWSYDGKRLAWASAAQTMGRSGIYVWDSSKNVPAAWVGDGNWPAWNATGDQIITTIPAANSTYLMTYTPEGKLLQALTPFPAPVLRGLAWSKLVMPGDLPQNFQRSANLTPAALWAANGEPLSEGMSRWALVELEGVQAPYPQIHDLADEAFHALRERVQNEAGWDALAALENAYVPITASLDPGFGEDWLYTGRAFAINSLMTNAGWMVAVREDFGAQTYWRLYLRTQMQDGSQGEPLRDTPWDLSKRYNLDPKDYEKGGDYSDVPAGYWVDVTSLALQYGWERVPALQNWRTFYRGARFTEFALTGGLDWYSAMLQIYPSDVLITPTKLLPPTLTPTRTPTPTLTPVPTRTRRPTITPGPSPTASNTPTPTRTPLPPTPTSTPLTVIP